MDVEAVVQVNDRDTYRASVRTRTAVAANRPAIEALRLLDDCGFRHLPVCADGRVCGIVSRYDFRAREHARMDRETGYFEMLR